MAAFVPIVTTKAHAEIARVLATPDAGSIQFDSLLVSSSEVARNPALEAIPNAVKLKIGSARTDRVGTNGNATRVETSTVFDGDQTMEVRTIAIQTTGGAIFAFYTQADPLILKTPLNRPILSLAFGIAGVPADRVEIIAQGADLNLTNTTELAELTKLYAIMVGKYQTLLERVATLEARL